MTEDAGQAETRMADMAAFPEMNPGPVVRTDLSGRILLLNAVARQLFTSDRVAECVGQHWLDVCPDADRRIWQDVLDGQDRLQHESEVGGRQFVFTYRRPAGVASVFIYGNDITERKRAERLAAEQAAEIAEMARFPEMNPGAVFRVDPAAKIVLANAAARALFGGDSLIGQCWKDLCPGMSDAAWTKILASTDVVVVEARLKERAFLFAHRVTPDARLVFVYGNEVTALRSAEEALRQSERMATLGTLAAGVAHELNNPAAAATRAAGQLRDALGKFQEAAVALGHIDLSKGRGEALVRIVGASQAERAAPPTDPMKRSDLESDVEAWLEEHEVSEAWELAPALVALGFDRATLTGLADQWGADHVAAIRWVARAQPVRMLAVEVGEATRRISEIVGALKSYSFLGQAPVRSVDVTRGIEDTLTLLRGVLKTGVTIVRDYGADLPAIDAYGSELNQVWTNLIHNAVDAMGGQGQLVIRTRRDREAIAVEIEDNGPGIPEHVLPRIFDAFFTTKEPGKGTGLGLPTSRNIVVKKHGGSIDVTSRPGSTRFIVTLPIHRAASGDATAGTP
jgi:signal transduction histidine kinase